MTTDLVSHLKDEKQSKFHEKMLDGCLADIKMSRSHMSKFYSEWDKQDQVYRGERASDQDDLKQKRQGKPEKMIVPTTRAQIESFVAFLFALFTQNATPYELTPRGTDDYGKKWEDCESVLSRDCSKSMWYGTIYQFLLDVGRFGLGILETTWTVEKVKVWVVPTQDVLTEMNGIQLAAPAQGEYKEFVKFEGNRVRKVSPYRWFPDTNFPLVDFHKGRFCGSEEDYSMGELRKLEASGEVAGVEYIEGPARDFATLRGGESRFSFGMFPDKWDNENERAPVCVTKMRKWIVPSDFMLDEKKPLGDEDFPVMYTIWYANDNRVIKCEPAKEWHQEYNYSIGQYTPDMHKTAMGLADLIYPIQDAISWFVNSHITSVRRVIANRNIINPTLVETKSYDGEGDIFMRKGFGRTDPRLAISQLPAQDVTAGHMGDVGELNKITDRVTGVNDNLQGQMNAGRRSAQENRVQTAGAASRLKMEGKLLWETGLGRNGRLMLSNSRQSLSLESFARAIGMQPEEAQDRFAAFQGSPEEIICGDDYLIFDSTLASEKGYQAQQLQELLSIVLQSNPMAAMQITQQIDPVKMVEEINYLRDGTDLARLKPDPGQQQMMPQPMPQMMPQPGAMPQPALA